MPSLIARYGSDAGPVLALNSHVDVVPVGERSAWKHDPFGATVLDGKIYGRGAGDAKASVAAQVMAGVAIARSGISLKGQLIVNEVADEESGGFRGADFVTRERFFNPDYAIIGEQTFNTAALGEKGSSPTRIQVFGRTAHGALPWEGANAVEGLAEVIVALRRRYWPELAQRRHPLFLPSSGSVNTIEGGVKTNVVPDYATAYLDRRLVPGESPSTVIAEVRRIAEAAVADMPGVSVVVEEQWPGSPAVLTEQESPLAEAMIGANRRLGLPETVRGFSMATDGRYFSRLGVPTIIYGPGDPGVAHIPDEWVGIDELLQGARAYVAAILALLS